MAPLHVFKPSRPSSLSTKTDLDHPKGYVYWVVFFLLLAVIILYAGYLLLNVVRRSPVKKEYACLIEPKKKAFTSWEGGRVGIPFRIKNLGSSSWSSRGVHPYFLSYHLLDEEENTIQYDNRRFPFPGKVSPGQSLEMTAFIVSPLEEGKYVLEFDLVREGKAWFKDYGSPTAKVSLSVKAKKWPETDTTWSLDYGKYTKFETSIPELDRIQKLIRLTLWENEVTFPGRTGLIRGFSAGKDYPQIWLRDAATIIPVSRYFYDEAYLCSWLEEHLAFQRQDGSLADWIDPEGHSDKNTTETDQEASAVLAARKVFELLGPRWLEKPISRKKIIQRLELALHFLLDKKMEARYGLLKGAHTADWGDVDIVDSNQKAVDTDTNTHWTVDIYDQSMFYEACRSLAEMFEALDQSGKASFWREKADTLRYNTDRWLWQEEKGFYRIHLHLDSLHHDFNEEDIFAMGGNTQAILSGLAGEEKSRRIIEEALRRQKTYGLSTISGTLLPPYPRHTFKHPMLDDPFEYQNGGQWDWFGGRLICAMFEKGYSHPALEKLLEIVHKNLANRSFYEWDTKEGIGRGNGFFCGSAGSVGRAIFEGLLGIKVRRDRLSLQPRLGKERAKIHVYIPSWDRFAAYQYRWDEKEEKVSLDYNSNVSGRGTIKILIPQKGGNTGRRTAESWEVLIDGRRTGYRWEKKNKDAFIVVETDFKNHRLEAKRIN